MIHDTTRRQFLGNAALGLAAALVGLPTPTPAPAAAHGIRTEVELVIINRSSKMLTLRTLGDLGTIADTEIVRLAPSAFEIVDRKEKPV